MNRTLLILLASLALLAGANAQISPIRLRVEQSNKTDTTSYKTVQSRSLNIFLNNVANEPQELKVKWAIFGRELKDKEIVVIEQGELSSSLKALGNEKLTTLVAQAVAEEERIGSKGKSEDTGAKMVGHGVQVFKGDKIVAEAYEPASMKASFGKASPWVKPAKKK